jgi:hypothetical protein
VSGPFDDLVTRLESIVDELDEFAFERLREASAAGVRSRPASDKTLTQARRAIEKAVHLLRGDDGDSDA